eukprot:CAMPEP_0174374250 /NCGR_PEP_ID=MMETSP0811_2-20130205/110225_1 /TAXON_ID=73025 ORGANISM="Eutreptiella gymnastica-like, Strain CCMP1594" /NCGR_SAMPLE_ID=MMETSP0811_2 /ASSEMBLY_ACC=CAM_ASM_000667 /LENGTH=103 /DNA_ID=CAMNT_0015523405 /DNA_START=30 /DNA_END=338 /DNA_ORIENTATION=+
MSRSVAISDLSPVHTNLVTSNIVSRTSGDGFARNDVAGPSRAAEKNYVTIQSREEGVEYIRMRPQPPAPVFHAGDFEESVRWLQDPDFWYKRQQQLSVEYPGW